MGYKGRVPQVRPFIALRYVPSLVGPLEDVTAPPYDVISPADQDQLYRKSPYNVVRLILGKDEPGDHAGNDKYSRGARHLRSWQERGMLAPTERPCVYPYEMRFRVGLGTRSVRGIVVEVGLEPFGASVLAHERTLRVPLEDRLRLLRAVQANLSPIYAVFRGPSGPVEDFLRAATAGRPDAELVDEDGTMHRLWEASDGAEEVATVLSGRPLMIADGHHRYEAALRHHRERHAGQGPGPWDGMMMFLVDAEAEDPPVLPVHRVLRATPPGLGEDGVRGDRVGDLTELLASLREEEMVVGIVTVEAGQVTHRVATLEGRPPAVCGLHRTVLDGIDPSDLDYVHDGPAAEAAVASGRATIAFLLPPTRVARIWSVVSSGGTLPEKSTYFWPKPRAGLLFRPITTQPEPRGTAGPYGGPLP